MSRSFGDDVAASVGVICSPDTTKRPYGNDDRFLVLGSDGIFDFVSNQVISSATSDAMKKKKDPQFVAQALVADATRKWQRNDKNYVDDITAVVVFLNAHPGKVAV
jgi:serine/threonine protein phosphatase PrpC